MSLWVGTGFTSTALPLVRSHERMEFKRCPKKWYWHWRRGLTPKVKTFGALDLGTWMHEAFKNWYGFGLIRVLSLWHHFTKAADAAIEQARRDGAPDHVIEKAEELYSLGEAMAFAYQDHYGQDEGIEVIDTEIPLEFSIPDYRGNVVALHRLKPDLVYADKAGDILLMEHKTAKSIRTEHLVIDDQARPYGAMAERALKNAGVIGKGDSVKGIMYNFVRKVLPDERQMNSEGKRLNKNGTVSAKQPAPQFKRYLVPLTKDAKRQSLQRIQRETILITRVAQDIRSKRLDPALLDKTPHHSCPKFCDYFAMCVAEENGSDISTMEKTMYTVQDPYQYEESADEVATFEMG